MTFATRFQSPGFDRRRMREALQEHGLDGILLTSPENVFYTTGYTALPSSGNPILYTLRNRLPFFSYVDGDGQVTLVCWGFSTQGVDFGADTIMGANDYAGTLDALRSLLAHKLRDRARLGIESTCPYFVLRLLEDLAGSQPALEVIDHVLAGLRLIKTAAEIALLKRSTAIIEGTVAELYGILYRGMGRIELTHEAKSRLLRNGADGISHITFSFAQANPEVEIDELIEEGRLITLDLGAIAGGYCSDNRRYAYAGSPPASLQQRYAAMVSIVDQVGAMLTPGTAYSTVFRRAVDLFAEHGIAAMARFNHVGHNIGLETEEEWIDDSPDKDVRQGMAVNIELYSMAETGEMIGNEETYIVEATGPVRVSTLPREIRRT